MNASKYKLIYSTHFKSTPNLQYQSILNQF